MICLTLVSILMSHFSVYDLTFYYFVKVLYKGVKTISLDTQKRQAYISHIAVSIDNTKDD